MIHKKYTHCFNELFVKKKNMCYSKIQRVSFPKNTHIREKSGNSMMKANFILKWDHGTKNCIFWSI